MAKSRGYTNEGGHRASAELLNRILRSMRHTLDHDDYLPDVEGILGGRREEPMLTDDDGRIELPSNVVERLEQARAEFEATQTAPPDELPDPLDRESSSVQTKARDSDLPPGEIVPSTAAGGAPPGLGAMDPPPAIDVPETRPGSGGFAPRGGAGATGDFTHAETQADLEILDGLDAEMVDRLETLAHQAGELNKAGMDLDALQAQAMEPGPSLEPVDAERMEAFVEGMKALEDIDDAMLDALEHKATLAAAAARAEIDAPPVIPGLGELDDLEGLVEEIGEAAMQPPTAMPDIPSLPDLPEPTAIVPALSPETEPQPEPEPEPEPLPEPEPIPEVPEPPMPEPQPEPPPFPTAPEPEPFEEPRALPPGVNPLDASFEDLVASSGGPSKSIFGDAAPPKREEPRVDPADHRAAERAAREPITPERAEDPPPFRGSPLDARERRSALQEMRERNRKLKEELQRRAEERFQRMREPELLDAPEGQEIGIDPEPDEDTLSDEDYLDISDLDAEAADAPTATDGDAPAAALPSLEKPHVARQIQGILRYASGALEQHHDDAVSDIAVNEAGGSLLVTLESGRRFLVTVHKAAT